MQAPDTAPLGQRTQEPPVIPLVQDAADTSLPLTTGSATRPSELPRVARATQQPAVQCLGLADARLHASGQPWRNGPSPKRRAWSWGVSAGFAGWREQRVRGAGPYPSAEQRRLHLTRRLRTLNGELGVPLEGALP